MRALTTSCVGEEVSSGVSELLEGFPLPMVHAATTGTAHVLPDRASVVAAFPGSEDACAAADTGASATTSLHADGAVIGPLSVASTSAHLERGGARAAVCPRGPHQRSPAAHHRPPGRARRERRERALLPDPPALSADQLPEPDHLVIAVR